MKTKRGVRVPKELLKPQQPKKAVLTVEGLIQVVEETAELDKETAKKVVYAILWGMIKSLRRREEVVLYGFGRFFVKMQRPSTIPRPLGPDGAGTGKPIYVPPKLGVTFKPAQYVRWLLNPDEFVPKQTTEEVESA